MNEALEALFLKMLSDKLIGGKHKPEDLLLRKKTNWLDKKEHADFEKAYNQALREQLIIRLKKRTGKGSGWHISLNPRRLKEIHEYLRQSR